MDQRAARTDVEDLATRMQEFGQTLTPTQQALLAEILHSAVTVTDPDDVSGHTLTGNLAPSQVLQSGGQLNAQYYYYAPVLMYYRYE
jgi:hypothetical protein